MTGIEITTAGIAIYGAALSTYVYHQSRIAVGIDLLRNMTSVNHGTTNDYVKITNKNKEPIRIKSIWISLLGDDRNKLYFLDSITYENAKIEGLNDAIYPSEVGFSLDKIKTIQVCTGHGTIYKKHFVNAFRRTINR